jgi:hypothetical protein
MEIWKDITGFDGRYEVSNLGRVRSLLDCLLRPKTPTLKIQSVDMNGYPTVNLYFHKKLIVKRIHRLVALAFIPNPANKPQVNHIDGVKSNNNLSNLEWVTKSENIQHSYNIGTHKRLKGEDATNVKWSNAEVIEIKNAINTGMTSKQLYEKFPTLNSKHLYLFRKNKTFKHLSVQCDNIKVQRA